MRRIDLNVDIGEGFPNDEALLEFATSANICCGEHAGSWELTLATIDLCRRRQVRVGIHPGFPDRATMGRVAPTTIPATWFESLKDQCQKFVAATEADYVKPHGAWYQALTCPDASLDIDFDSVANCMRMVQQMGREYDLPIMILSQSLAELAIKGGGGRVIREGFADRGYEPDGTLVQRGKPGAILADQEQIKAQVLRLATAVDSICVHGDTPDCLVFAEMIKRTLIDAGYEVGI